MAGDTQHVALFIDFENLIYGLEDEHGQDFADQVELESLFRLAEEYGHVVLANAYADWRHRTVNQFQTDLYRLGIDLIHVFAKRHMGRIKNAVDVKMAVDAIEAIWTLSHVGTFVIVSGDRDFIHVLKTLRRHGKTIIGVSPAQAVSDDFAALCDRFIRYGALVATYEDQGTLTIDSTSSAVPNLDVVRKALRAVLAEKPNGIKGAQIKPLLRRKLSVTFDESEYGFSRLSDLLYALSDTVQVVSEPGGSDIVVYPADSETMAPMQPVEDGRAALIERAGLKQYRFDANAERRRLIIRTLFEEMKGPEPFRLADVYEQILETLEDVQISTSVLAKYQNVLWQNRVFHIEADQRSVPTRERLMQLDPDVETPDQLIYRYEAGITYKINAAANELSIPVSAELLADILGLGKDETNLAYCRKLLEYAQS